MFKIKYAPFRKLQLGLRSPGALLSIFGTCRSKEKIQMNVWNTVNLERANRKGELTVNGKDRVRGEAPVRLTFMDLWALLSTHTDGSVKSS